MCPCSHQQLPKEFVIISGSKVDSFILALVTHSLMLRRFDERNNLSPEPLITSAVPFWLVSSLSLRLTSGSHFLSFFQSFPFPPIVGIKSTLHQSVSHGNVLTSSHNTLFLFLRFLFLSVPPSLPPQTHILWPPLIPSFCPLCCLPGFHLFLSKNFGHESKKKVYGVFEV